MKSLQAAPKLSPYVPVICIHYRSMAPQSTYIQYVHTNYIYRIHKLHKYTEYTKTQNMQNIQNTQICRLRHKIHRRHQIHNIYKYTIDTNTQNTQYKQIYTEYTKFTNTQNIRNTFQYTSVFVAVDNCLGCISPQWNRISGPTGSQYPIYTNTQYTQIHNIHNIHNYTQNSQIHSATESPVSRDHAAHSSAPQTITIHHNSNEIMMMPIFYKC